MNDRELLEIAAKAAGIKCEVIEFGELGVFKGCELNPEFTVIFNPLYDDGDAFRLAVSLGMEVYIDDHPDGCDCVEAESYTHKSGRYLISLSAGNDKYAAARKAIVMVAAEIGRNMK